MDTSRVKKTLIKEKFKDKSLIDKTKIRKIILKEKAIFKEKSLNKNKATEMVIKVITVIGIALSIYFCYWIYKEGLFTNKEKLTAFLNASGPLAPIYFIGIQIIQSVVSMIPGAVVCPLGALFFGPWKGFALNFIGIMIGSVIDFFIAKKYGKSIVITFVGKKGYAKGMKWLNLKGNFEKAFAIGMLIPVAPQDTFCMLAGLTDMTFKKFLAITVVGKIVTLFVCTNVFYSAINFITGLLK